MTDVTISAFTAVEMIEKFRKWCRLLGWHRILIFISLLYISIERIYGAVCIEGTHVITNFNPRTGHPIGSSVRPFKVVVEYPERKYALNYTNGPYWVAIVSDDQSTYVRGNPQIVDKRPGSVPDYEYCLIYNGGVPMGMGGHTEEAWYVWLVYCMPTTCAGDLPGVRSNLPARGRDWDPMDFGWRWEFQLTASKMFIRSATLVRDRSLDRPNHLELIRPLLYTPPQTAFEWQLFFQRLQDRRAVPDGFTRMMITAQRILETNGLEIPTLVNVTVFDPMADWADHKKPLPIEEKHSIKVLSVGMGNWTETSIQQASAQTVTVVGDFRFYRIREDRVFPCASYKLSPGQPFRGTNDSELLAQAERHLRRGRKYYEPPIERKHWVLWAALPVVILPPAVYMLWALHRRRAARIPS